MPSKLLQTALSYIDAFKTLSSDSFLAVMAPTAIQEFAPASITPPGPMDPTGFANHISKLSNVLAGFPVYPKEIYENEEKRQVTLWCTSLAIFRDEVRDDSFTDAEWSYRGEYIFILTMDESGEKIVRVIEFLDSSGTQRLWELMARAKKNLQDRRENAG